MNTAADNRNTPGSGALRGAASRAQGAASTQGCTGDHGGGRMTRILALRLVQGMGRTRSTGALVAIILRIDKEIWQL